MMLLHEFLSQLQGGYRITNQQVKKYLYHACNPQWTQDGKNCTCNIYSQKYEGFLSQAVAVMSYTPSMVKKYKVKYYVLTF